MLLLLSALSLFSLYIYIYSLSLFSHVYGGRAGGCCRLNMNRFTSRSFADAGRCRIAVGLMHRCCPSITEVCVIAATFRGRDTRALMTALLLLPGPVDLRLL